MSNLSKSLTLKNYKKGLFRNLKLNSGQEMRDKQLKIEDLPFWCDVYNKDFSLKLDEIYGESEFSKAEIVQKYQLFRWASSNQPNSNPLFSNKHNLDLNFGRINFVAGGNIHILTIRSQSDIRRKDFLFYKRNSRN